MTDNNRKLLATIETTLALSQQFVSSLSAASTTPTAPADSGSSKSPLPLLLASAQSLKSHTTKLSLLAINSPFTPSAIITVLSEVNSSILPSLVTATLLVVPSQYTEIFKHETHVLVKNILHELRALVEDVKSIAHKEGKSLSNEEKSNITSTTGRVWKACDDAVKAVTDGVVGLVIAKAKEHLELVKDGIRELEEWDPEESDDEWDDAFGDGDDDDDDDDGEGVDKDRAGKDDGAKHSGDGEDDAEMTAKLHKEKKQLLRLLTPVSNMYTSIISNRLKKMEDKDILPAHAPQLDILLGHLSYIPHNIDEVVGSLYEHDIQSAEASAAAIHSTAISAVDVVRLPWPKPGDTADTTGKDDKFTKWADVWSKVLEEIRRPNASADKSLSN